MSVLLPESTLRGWDQDGLSEVASTEIPWQLQQSNLTPLGVVARAAYVFPAEETAKDVVFTAGDEAGFTFQQQETASSHGALA